MTVALAGATKEMVSLSGQIANGFFGFVSTVNVASFLPLIRSHA